MIFKINTLDINTEVITSKLLELKSHWELKSSDFPFYTLGKSAYLEGRIPEYKDQKDKFNKLLLDNFSDLYDIILTYLSKELNEPVTLTEDLAYPGFHIFESDPRFKGVAGNWHIDIPQKTLELTGTNNSTVTVVIKLPTLGGGIDWLQRKIIDASGSTDNRADDRIASGSRVSKTSKIGEISFGFASQKFSGGATTQQLWGGYEFGSNKFKQFPSWSGKFGRGSRGWFIYPTLRANQPYVIDQWESAFNQIVKEW